MSILKFIGNGSCFNISKRNTSCYYKDNDNLLLIDCGEDIFKELISKDILRDIKNIYVTITHLHSDHVGSLPSLIFYCNIVLKIKVTVIYPQQENITTLLTLMGVNKFIYNYLNPETEINVFGEIFIKSCISIHTDSIVAYSYMLTIDNNKIFYSGDNSILNQKARRMFENNELQYWYQDVSSHGSGHLLLDVLDKEIKTDREKIYCIHLENDELINNIINLGFKIPCS